jgi:hypothetical protein
MQIRHAQKGDEAELARLLEEMEHHYSHAPSASAGAAGAAMLVAPPPSGMICLVAEAGSGRRARPIQARSVSTIASASGAKARSTT